MARLKHNPADILSRLLISKGLGTEPGSSGSWPIHVGVEPDRPENVLTVKGTVGTDDGRNMNDGSKSQHYGIQIRIRSTTAKIGYDKAAETVQVLTEGIYRETVVVDSESYFIQCASRVSDPIELPKEPTSSRNIHTVNALITVRSVTL